MASKAAKKSPRDTHLEVENAALKQQLSEFLYRKRGDNITKVVVTGIRTVGTVLCVSFVSDLVKALSGKNTKADITFNFGAKLLSFFNLDVEIINVETVYLIAFVILTVLAFFAVVWAFGERVLRKRAIEHFQERIGTQEHSIDPDRTSSNLTPRGETHPGDRV